MRRLILVAAVTMTACSSNNPSAPTPQPSPTPTSIAACQTNRTAQLLLSNASPNGYTFDVLIDETLLATLTPGQSVQTTIAAEADHTIVSRLVNSSVVGCASTTSFGTCTSQSLTCRY
jgi:hypothetical protein